jgi:hypothetical protein
MNRDDIIRTIDWILDLCPEIQQWQAEIIAEYASNLVKNEHDACVKVCEERAKGWDSATPARHDTYGVMNRAAKCEANALAAAIRARGQS